MPVIPALGDGTKTEVQSHSWCSKFKTSSSLSQNKTEHPPHPNTHSNLEVTSGAGIEPGGKILMPGRRVGKVHCICVVCDMVGMKKRELPGDPLSGYIQPYGDLS